MKPDIYYPLFTVIIPQKDRAEYIFHTLRTCMIQDYPNFEVIVSDDCSEDNSVEVISELAKKDPRIKLFAHDHHLGMRDNFEFALSQVKSGYVMALGGDDGLTPGCIWRMYEILQQTERQLLTWPMSGYIYPKNEGGSGTFYVKRSKTDNIRIIKSESLLNSLAKNFKYHPNDLCPMFYMKGVASIELVNRVKSRTPDGCFYHCPTPDGFSGVVLAGEVEDYVYSPEPLSISGTTVKSQGQNYRRTDKKSREEAEQFFNDNIRRTMHKELASQPYSPLIPLMTADYLLTCRDLPGWPGKFEMFSFESLLRASFSFIETSSYESEVLVRELNILKEIAKQHHLERLFDELYNTTKVRKYQGKSVNGFTLTHSVRFNATELGINNIYDAALATKFVYEFFQKVSLKELIKMAKNTLSLYLNTKRYKKVNLPAM